MTSISFFKIFLCHPLVGSLILACYLRTLKRNVHPNGSFYSFQRLLEKLEQANGCLRPGICAKYFLSIPQKTYLTARSRKNARLWIRMLIQIWFEPIVLYIYQKHFQLVPLHKSKPQCIAVLGPQQTSELLKPLGLIFQKQLKLDCVSKYSTNKFKFGSILVWKKPEKCLKNKQITECL